MFRARSLWARVASTAPKGRAYCGGSAEKPTKPAHARVNTAAGRVSCDQDAEGPEYFRANHANLLNVSESVPCININTQTVHHNYAASR